MSENSQFPEAGLSPATVDLLQALFATAPALVETGLSKDTLVRYVAQAATPQEAAMVEKHTARNDADRRTLVDVWDCVDELRRKPVGDIHRISRGEIWPEDGFAGEASESHSFEAEIARLYLEVLATPTASNSAGIAALLKSGWDQSRLALATLAALGEARRPRLGNPAFASAMRSSSAVVSMEDAPAASGRVEASERGVSLVFDEPASMAGDEIFVAVDAPGHRLRLTHGLLEDGSITLPLDRAVSNSLRFTVRLGDWPTNSEGPFLTFVGGPDAAPEDPFIELVNPPTVNFGKLKLMFRWVQDSDGQLAKTEAGELETSFTTGPETWQVLGRQEHVPGPSVVTIEFEFPGEDGPFPWPLRFLWQSPP